MGIDLSVLFCNFATRNQRDTDYPQLLSLNHVNGTIRFTNNSK